MGRASDDFPREGRLERGTKASLYLIHHLYVESLRRVAQSAAQLEFSA